MEVLAIIPARGGSKRVKDKNIYPLMGKPLIAYSIEQALHSGSVTRVVVSTDNLKIKEAALAAGAEVIDRPEELATDTAPTLGVLQHTLHHLKEKEGYVPDVVALLQPTCPLRISADIDACVELLKKNTDADTVVTVRPAEETPYWMFTIKDDLLEKMLDTSATRSQDLPKAYLLNGAVYVFRPEHLLTGKKTLGVLGVKNIPYVMPLERSHDIDTMDDMKRVEEILRK
jgi:CMP-N-acetylneuraminic acid synthetase